MPITPNSARAYHGLQATAEPTSEGVTGTLTIGQGQTATTLSGASESIVLAVEVDSTYNVAIAMDTLIPVLAGAGVAQVETATAAGTITASGNATVIVTGDDITGSPLTLSVAVTNGDTASTWAGKVRIALNNSVVADLYTVGGSTTAITLTRTDKRYNDPTLNISLNNGTCAGITPALTSASTTAGVNPAKCWRVSGTTFDGTNFEGVDLPDFGAFYGMQIRSIENAFDAECGSYSDKIAGGEVSQKSAGGGLLAFTSSDDLVITGTGGYAKGIITITYGVA